MKEFKLTKKYKKYRRDTENKIVKHNNQDFHDTDELVRKFTKYVDCF